MGSTWRDLAPRLKSRVPRGDQKPLAAEFDLTPSQMNRYLSGKTTPDPVLALRLAHRLGLNLAVEAGITPTPAPTVADWLQVRGPKGRPLDVVAVPKVGFRVAAGFAAFPQPEEDEPGLYSFRPEFIRHVLGGLPKNPDSTWGKLACVQLRRDAWSMYPTIRPSAVVLVRMGVVADPRDVKPRRIYLVDEPGDGSEHGLVVKRVTFNETAGRGVLVLESDNREARTEFAPRIIDLTDRDVSTVVRGKVVWWSVSAEEAER